MRIGHGYDVHRFQKGIPLILGGVEIPYELGMEAHSDGDVVIHALCDALLGAAALGDIGQHFPESDSQYKNISSRILLSHVIRLLRENNYQIMNADITIIAEAPRLASYIPSMRTTLATDLNIEPNQINLKATTTEKMGFTGRKEGIAVYAVVLIN